MRSLSKKEFISTMIVNNAFLCMFRQHDTAKAIKYLNIAIKEDSTNADAIIDLANIRGDTTLYQKAIAMGFSRGYSESFRKKQQESILKQIRREKP